MSYFNKFKTAGRSYQAPDCEACPMLAGSIICDSLSDAQTSDWVYDDNEF